MAADLGARVVRDEEGAPLPVGNGGAFRPRSSSSQSRTVCPVPSLTRHQAKRNRALAGRSPELEVRRPHLPEPERAEVHQTSPRSRPKHGVVSRADEAVLEGDLEQLGEGHVGPLGLGQRARGLEDVVAACRHIGGDAYPPLLCAPRRLERRAVPRVVLPVFAGQADRP